mgnify:CR=1 FL=1|jgi:hypothetical protein
MENVIQFKPKTAEIESTSAEPEVKILEREIKSFQLDALCPKCESIMNAISVTEIMQVWREKPGKEFYPHVCTNADCKHEVNLPIRYPTMGYRFV